MRHWEQDERSKKTHKARELDALWLIFFQLDIGPKLQTQFYRDSATASGRT